MKLSFSHEWQRRTTGPNSLILDCFHPRSIERSAEEFKLCLCRHRIDLFLRAVVGVDGLAQWPLSFGPGDNFGNGARHIHGICAANCAVLLAHACGHHRITDQLVFASALFKCGRITVSIHPDLGWIAARLDNGDINAARNHFIGKLLAE